VPLRPPQGEQLECRKGCGRKFEWAPGRGAHERYCGKAPEERTALQLQRERLQDEDSVPFARKAKITFRPQDEENAKALIRSGLASDENGAVRVALALTRKWLESDRPRVKSA